jgi:hypothetical protein
VKPIRVTAVLSSCTILLGRPVAGQEVYRAPPDTVFVVVTNPYRMYWVRGGDTISQPMHSVAVEAQRWRRDGERLQVTVRDVQLDVHRRERVDTFTITPLGAVTAINGDPPGLNERVDLLLRLPGKNLTPGLVWADTLQTTQDTPRGEHAYTVARTYNVDRLRDSAGLRLAEVSATGLVHYRDGWWVDSASGTFATIDVAGPDTEHFVFAVSDGRLLRRSWSMRLTGQGMLPADGGRMDTTAAGLISSEIQEVVSRDRARLLSRPMPGTDTSVTLNGGIVFLHTVRRGQAAIESGMARNDGLVGTARAAYANGAVTSYDVLWTDTAATPRHIAITVAGDSLAIHDAGRPDTMVGIPAPWWGIADYAMGELLVPVLLAHPADSTEHAFAILRPYPRHWDVGKASLRPVGENYVAHYLLGSDTLGTYFLITRDGDLLLGQNSDPTGAQRVPPEGSARRRRLQAILEAMRAKR